MTEHEDKALIKIVIALAGITLLFLFWELL